jgi:raffinose/stachyose/melibiose transport system substrate-binding protein
MWYQGSFILSKFLTSNKLQYPVDWFPYPQIGSQKPTVSVFAESTYMINKKSKYKDQAAKFLNFIVSPQAQRYMLAHESPFAANRSVKPVGTPPMVQRLGNLISSYPNATFMHIDHALAPGVSQPYLEALQAVLAGTMTPAQAAQKTETAAIKTQGKVR